MNKPKMPKIFKAIIALTFIWWFATLLIPVSAVVYMLTRSAFWHMLAVSLTSIMCLTEMLMQPSIELWYRDKSIDDAIMDVKDACYNINTDEEKANQDYEEFLHSDNRNKRDLRLLLTLVSAINAVTMIILFVNIYRTVLAPFVSICLMIGACIINRILFKKVISNGKEASND